MSFQSEEFCVNQQANGVCTYLPCGLDHNAVQNCTVISAMLY